MTFSSLNVSGRHYFRNTKTAIFDLHTAVSDLGTAAVSKQNSAPPPSNAIVGRNGKGFGAVPWLRLLSVDKDAHQLKEVYRINTAGGNPPQTCANMPKAFEVQYSAE